MVLIYGATILCAGIRSILTKQNGRMGASGSLFNFLRSFSAFTLFAVLAVASGFDMHTPTLLWGLLYGALYCGSCFCGVRAMARGPLSITSSLVAFSLIIPCVFGAVFFQESIGVFDIVGFVLIAAAILAMNQKKSPSKTQDTKECSGGVKFQKGWWVYVLGTVLCDGVRSIIKTIHQKSFPGLYRYEFMCVGMLVGSVVFTLLLLKDWRQVQEKGKQTALKGSVCGVVAGFANGTYNYLVLYLAGLESAVVMFPIVSVSSIAISLIAGRLLFKERLNMLQIVGVILAAAAIFFIKI